MKTKSLFLAFLLLFIFNMNAQSTDPSPYCNASFDEPNGSLQDYITNVTLGSLNNSSGQANAPRYIFYNNLAVPSFTAGGNYNLSVSFSVTGGNGYGVWIDYNQNNIFEASEKVAGTTTTPLIPADNNSPSTSQITQTITIPASATNGNTRMRVRIVEDDNYSMTHDFNELPCNLSNSAIDTMDNGETEDYIINITGGSLATHEVQTADQLKFYPNPVTSIIHLINKKQSSKVTVTDMTGRIVLITTINENNEIDISKLNSGKYFIKIDNEVLKIIKK